MAWESRSVQSELPGNGEGIGAAFPILQSCFSNLAAEPLASSQADYDSYPQARPDCVKDHICSTEPIADLRAVV